MSGAHPAPCRICPRHLRALDNRLRCPAGHACQRWAVVDRRGRLVAAATPDEVTISDVMAGVLADLREVLRGAAS